MFDVCFRCLSDFVRRHRRVVVTVLLLLVVISIARLPRIGFDNNIERMLPASPDVRRSIRFLRQSGISDKIVMSISLPTHCPETDRLITAADRLDDELRGDLITEVVTGVPHGNMVGELVELMTCAPQLLDPADLDAMRHELTPEGIDRRIGATYRRLLTPGGGLMVNLLVADPIGIAGELLKELQRLSASFGYRVKVVRGHLLSEDERHALLILTTPVTLTDGFGSRALLKHIETCVTRSPYGIEAIIVGGHRHTVSNEDVIRRDVKLICVFATLGFLLLFVAAFRDWRAGWVLLMPVSAIIVAIAVSSMFLGAVSYFIVGMSAVLVGIAIDYAIHVYIAKRSGGEGAVASIAKPISAGAFTTVSVFFAFFFSSVSGYTQLACFYIVGILACLALSLFLLPYLVKTKSGNRSTWSPQPRVPRSRTGRSLLISVWIVFLVVLAFAATKLVFENDVTQFDGSEKTVLDDEENFRRIWGGRDEPGILVVEGKALEPVLRKNDQIARGADELIGPGNLTTLAAIWPSRRTRVRNLASWRSFWQEIGPGIKARLVDSQEKYGFTRDAFQPFLKWVDGGQVKNTIPQLDFLDRIKERFLAFHGGKVWAISYFDDTDENMRRLSVLTADGEPSAYLVSRRALGKAISQSVSRETVRLSLIAGALILLVLFVLVRDIRLALLALAPVGTAIVVMLGMLPLLGMPLTAASIIAAMVGVGLCIDYGIFMVHSEHHRTQCGTALSVTLSAATTLVAAGALLFVRHPVMYAIGVTLVCGVAAGYVCALWIVPTLYVMTKTEDRTD